MSRINDLCLELESETDDTRRRALVLIASDYLRRLEKSLKDEEELHSLAVRELGHRLKNKVATIQSIIAYQLRDNETARDTILRRLSALSSADMLIEAAQGQGASVKDIIIAELGPYEISRATVDGPQISLPPKLALVLGLITHELATNAAKYGALSDPLGRISFCWWIAETKLLLEWRESGGPSVIVPTRKGFGTTLLSGALAQFGGAVDTEFAAKGLVCKISLPISAN